MAETLAHADSALPISAQLYCSLYDLDGWCFAWQICERTHPHAWVQSEIACRFDVDESDVHVSFEDEHTDTITVAGNPVAYLYVRAAR